MIDVVVLAVWAIAYIAAFAWLVVFKRRTLLGGLSMLALAIVPAEYGRWITPSEWHDYVGMMIYYLPTMLAALIAIIVVLVGASVSIFKSEKSR